jgi:hypothetical protein
MTTSRHDDVDELLEERLRSMFHAAADPIDARPDLFARVLRSLEEQQSRNRFRRQAAIGVTLVVGTIAAVLLAATDFSPQRAPEPSPTSRWTMHWWILELVTTLVLVVLAVVLGPLIKRFGKSYAADVFRANPRTGKSYIVLTDVAYYLLFGAYILFTTTFELPSDWRSDAIVGAQLKQEASRVGGILLIIGALHCANIVLLPVIGRLFTLNRHLEDGDPTSGGAARERGPRSSVTPAATGGGTWILRIEPAPPEDPDPTTRPPAGR